MGHDIARQLKEFNLESIAYSSIARGVDGKANAVTSTYDLSLLYIPVSLSLSLSLPPAVVLQ